MLRKPLRTGMTRSHHAIGWAYALVCVVLVRGALRPAPVTHVGSAVSSAPAATEVEWFRRAKPYCNAVEVQTLQQRQGPPPATAGGSGYHAACFALAGRIDDARRIIDRLAPKDRLTAVGIVFNVGHPVADAGDDRSAGPIMEMVIDYWPNHYMALYHAGVAEYMLGQRELARHNLKAFLEIYRENDGWTANAKTILKRLDDPVAPPLQRLPEPGAGKGGS